MPNYYDDQKRLIAIDSAGLILYFQSIENPDGSTNTAYNMPITLPCAPTAIIQVKSSGNVPKFIYIGGLSPKNKVYPRLLKSDTLNLDSLCNGSSLANLLAAPDCGTVICEAITVAAPDCGTVIFITGYSQYVTITAYSLGGWALYGTQVPSTVTADGVVTINIAVINSGITIPTSFTSEKIVTIGINGRSTNNITMISAEHPNLPPSSQIDISPASGHLSYTGDQTSVDSNGAVIQIINIQYNLNA